MTKITSNTVKVGVHCYVPNAKISLRSKFNSKILDKSETLWYGFADVGIKGGEIFWSVSKFCVHACLSDGAFKSMIKFQLYEIAQK